MTDYFTKRVPRLPPWSYQGETGTDPTSSETVSTLTSHSWAGHLLGSADRAYWPILWSLPACAQALGFTEATFESDGGTYLVPSAAWGYKQTQPRCPRTILFSGFTNAQAAASISSISTQLQELGVLACDAPATAESVWLPRAYLSETTEASSDTIIEYDTYGNELGSGPQSYDVWVASQSKFIGGDLLILSIGPSYFEFGLMQAITPFPGPGYSGNTAYQEFTDKLNKQSTEAQAAAAKLRTVQTVFLFQPQNNTPDGLESGWLTAVKGSIAAHAPSFVVAQYLADQTDTTLEAAATAAIQDFFGI